MNIEIHQLWSALLKLKQALKTCYDPLEFAILSFQEEKTEVFINELGLKVKSYPSVVISTKSMDNLNGLHSRFKFESLIDVQLMKAGDLTTAQIDFIKHYLPYALMPVNARRAERTITISHFAQSLDGKIATALGNSQWIGNRENLVHAHRMRALCDAILIGTNTLKNDNPSLTVREVSGNDPVKVVIGKSDQLDFNKLLKNDAHVIHITDKKYVKKFSQVETIDYQSDGMISCRYILEKLFHKGIYSLYIEGGSKTASHFLNKNYLDIIQLHVAPIVMGSGISSFILPEIENLDDAIAFRKHNFQPVGNHIMFTGEVERN